MILARFSIVHMQALIIARRAIRQCSYDRVVLVTTEEGGCRLSLLAGRATPAELAAVHADELARCQQHYRTVAAAFLDLMRDKSRDH